MAFPARLRSGLACPRAAPEQDITDDFKEQVPKWLSLKEKFRRIAGAIAGHTIR
jgi:hypothetical protein